MNFDYSDEQKMLKDAARRFLSVHCTVERVRAVLDNPAKSYDEALWKSMGTQGWFGAAIPERYGGLGLGRVELCAIAEELGRVIAPVPFASTVYFLAEALMLAGNEEQKARYLPQIAAAELIGCFATSEAPGPFTASRMDARGDSGSRLLDYPAASARAADRNVPGPGRPVVPRKAGRLVRAILGPEKHADAHHDRSLSRPCPRP